MTSEGDSPDETANDRCSNCGDHIDTKQWHPVTSREEDGTVVVYTFCSDSCQAAWISEH